MNMKKSLSAILALTMTSMSFTGVVNAETQNENNSELIEKWMNMTEEDVEKEWAPYKDILEVNDVVVQIMGDMAKEGTYQFYVGSVKYDLKDPTLSYMELTVGNEETKNEVIKRLTEKGITESYYKFIIDPNGQVSFAMLSETQQSDLETKNKNNYGDLNDDGVIGKNQPDKDAPAMITNDETAIVTADSNSNDASEKTVSLFGDLNYDGVADLTDLTCLSLYLLKDIEFSEDQVESADIDMSGEVDIADLAYYKQYVCKDESVINKLRINVTRAVLVATVKEVNDKKLLVIPVEGSWERKSESLIYVNYDPEKLTVSVGDTVEIIYNGFIMETYPAQIYCYNVRKLGKQDTQATDIGNEYQKKVQDLICGDLKSMENTNEKKYSVTVESEFDLKLESQYAAGETVTFKLPNVTDSYYDVVVTGKEVLEYTEATDPDYTYFTFIMPEKNVLVTVKSVDAVIPLHEQAQIVRVSKTGGEWGTKNLMPCDNKDELDKYEACRPVKVINSVDELSEFVKTIKESYDTGYGWDGKISFDEAVTKYDEKYFENQTLVIVGDEEPSGSNKLRFLNTEMSQDSDLTIMFTVDVPEAGTCDMANWFMFVELSKTNYSCNARKK